MPKMKQQAIDFQSIQALKKKEPYRGFTPETGAAAARLRTGTSNPKRSFDCIRLECLELAERILAKVKREATKAGLPDYAALVDEINARMFTAWAGIFDNRKPRKKVKT